MSAPFFAQRGGRRAATAPAAAAVLAPCNRLSRERLAVAALAMVAALVVYLSCLSATLTYGGDSGELIAASYRLGIAHPTGYPLYCLLGRTFADLVPLGQIAWRYSLLSALCGALTVGTVAATVHLLVGNGPGGEQKPLRLVAALGASALLTGLYYFSSQCVLAEVYSLNALMLASLIGCAVAFNESGDIRWAYSCAALLGLALNAHLSCIFLVPGLVLSVLVQHRRRWSALGGLRRHLARMVLLFAAAYLLTLYLPLRSAGFAAPPPAGGGAWAPLDWTHPATAANWYAHVSARQYKTWLLKPVTMTLGGHALHLVWFRQTLAESAHRLLSLGSALCLQLTLCLPFLLLGIAASWRRPAGGELAEGTDPRWLGALLTSTVLFNIGLEINYQVGDLPNFFFPVYIAVALWLGLGLARAMALVPPTADTVAVPGATFPRPESRQLSPRALRCALLVLLLATTSLFQFASTYALICRRGHRAALDTALQRASIAESVAAATGSPPRVVLTSDDALWGFWYARYVLGRAAGSVTPWGAARTAALKQDKLVQLVSNWQRSGPVLLGQWDAGTDRRYPLLMLSPDAVLCLATHNLLPPSAQVLGAAPRQPDFTIGRATFHTRAARVARVDGVLPVLKRSDDAGFELDFTLARAQPLAAAVAGGPTIDRRQHPGAVQVGYIEVFMAAAGRIKNLQPAQGDIREKVGGVPPLIAWRQRRRLVVPAVLPPRANGYTTRLRAAVPLLMEPDARLGRTNVWVRIVTSEHDSTRPWQRMGDVMLGEE